MKTVFLETFTDEYGLTGLAVIGMQRNEYTNANSNGEAIAHDLLEHVNGVDKIGDITDELEAMGALWYVRGQWGEITRLNGGSIYTPQRNIAGDITRTFRDCAVGGQYVNLTVPRSRAVYDDEGLQEILNEADASWRDEFGHDELPEASEWKTFRAVALYRMRQGYSKARKRYEHLGRFAANNLFWAISDAVQAYAKNPAEYEGARYRLRYGNGEATCCEDYGDFDE